MKRLLTIVLLFVAPPLILADETQGAYNSFSPGPVSPLDIGSADVNVDVQNLANPQGTPAYAPNAFGGMGISPQTYGNFGSGMNLGNPTAANEAAVNPAVDMTGSGGAAGGSGSGGAGSGMPLVPYNQGFPGY